MIKIDSKLLRGTALKSRISERKRANHNFHKEYGERVQRFINVIQPQSIIEPHLHKNTFEVFIALKGKIEVDTYTPDGKVKEKCVIEPGGKISGVEVKENEWHSIKALEPDSVVYIVMEGPYNPKEHKTFMD
jgi:cupin fold WbuC family metalloprotein